MRRFFLRAVVCWRQIRKCIGILFSAHASIVTGDFIDHPARHGTGFRCEIKVGLRSTFGVGWTKRQENLSRFLMGSGLMPDPARLAVQNTTILVEAFEHFATPYVCK